MVAEGCDPHSGVRLDGRCRAVLRRRRDQRVVCKGARKCPSLGLLSLCLDPRLREFLALSPTSAPAPADSLSQIRLSSLSLNALWRCFRRCGRCSRGTRASRSPSSAGPHSSPCAQTPPTQQLAKVATFLHLQSWLAWLFRSLETLLSRRPHCSPLDLAGFRSREVMTRHVTDVALVRNLCGASA